MLEEFYEKYNYWITTDSYKNLKKEEVSSEVKLSNFLSKFTIDYIRDMSIDEYVTGKKNGGAFCPFVEQTLKWYGSISGRTTAYQKYIIYWDHNKKDYIFGDKRTKQRSFFGDNKDDIFKNIKIELIKLIEATEMKDYASIVSCHLNDQFKNKVSYLYDHMNQLPIYSNDDLDKILTLFDVPFNSKLDRVFKRKILYDFYVSSGIKKIMTPFIFMNFLYNEYGYRIFLRNVTPMNAVASNLVLKDVKIKSLLQSKKSISARGGLVNPITENQKKITGKKAEELVIDYLNANKGTYDVNNLVAWCNIIY